MTIISCSSKETEEIGEKIGAKLKGNEIISLWGKMGAGKTCITRGIARSFGMEELVSSPTFAIVNHYKSHKFNIYHFDMYRIGNQEDLESTGFYDCIGNGIVIIEWSENIKDYIPKNCLTIKIEFGENEFQKKIHIEGIDI